MMSLDKLENAVSNPVTPYRFNSFSFSTWIVVSIKKHCSVMSGKPFGVFFTQ